MNITPIIEAAILLIFSVVVYFIIPIIKERVSAEQFENLRLWVSVAVKAAEQIYQGSKRGPEKKRYVKDFLESKGIQIDTESLNALIEATVHDQFGDFL